MAALAGLPAGTSRRSARLFSAARRRRASPISAVASRTWRRRDCSGWRCARQDLTPPLRLFLVLAFGFDLFWCSGQMIYTAALRRDDWYFVLEGLAPGWL
jgi:hypothetical protein